MISKLPEIKVGEGDCIFFVYPKNSTPFVIRGDSFMTSHYLTTHTEHHPCVVHTIIKYNKQYQITSKSRYYYWSS